MRSPDGTTWIGLGLGDASEEVRSIKSFMRGKFASYAGHLADTDLYDQEMVDAVTEMQRRYGIDQTGIINYAVKVKMGYVKQAPPGKVGTLLTVQGTGVDMWTGPPADTARAVEGDWEWQPIGNYPASPFPMWASIWQGITELRFQLRRHADANPVGKIALAGYSQGAIVTSWVYKWDIQLPGGILHDLLPRVEAGVTWGNPMAQKGVFNGNRYAGWPVPEGMGINRDRMENTPALWLDFAHGRNSQWGQDIYCDRPDNLAGEDMELICDFVMAQDLGAFFVNLGSKALATLNTPAVELPAMFDAIMQAGMFFVVRGTRPHLDYDINPAVDYLRGVAAGIRAGKTATIAA